MTTELEQRTWFYIRDRKKIGPVPWMNLRDLAVGGQLRPADMVLPGGATHWIQALSVEGLFSLPNSLPTQGPPPLPSAATISLPTAAPAATFSQAALPHWSGAAPTLPTIPGYNLVGELGRGGMGVVYKAEHIKLKRLVALKMVLGGAVAGVQQFERFRAEAEAVARLQHPNIVQIYEVGEHGGLPFFSLEYCAGGNLAQRMDGTPLAVREAAGMVETLSRAMHAAHERNIVHRDLKPANILLAGDGAPKITDFGLAKKLDATEALTQSGAVMGTPSYMAPEQALGKSRDLGPSADIYALGAILYELLTGRPPFKGATAMETMVQVASDEPVPPSRMQPKLPPDLETICLKCLEKSTSRRYPTAQALADDLHRYLAGEPIQARPAGRMERCWKWARRRPAAAALMAVSALAALAMFAGALYFTVQLGHERNTALAEKVKAEQQRERAEDNEAEARRQEAEVKWQKEAVEQERKRAKDGEDDALKKLDQSRRSLMTAQLWRVAGLWDHDPLAALHVLQNENDCPPELRDFAWGYYRQLCGSWFPKYKIAHKDGVSALSVSPDGKLLATAGNDGTLKLWDARELKVLATLKGHDGPVNAVAFSPDGQFLASGGKDRTIRIWNVAEKKEAGPPLIGHTVSVSALAWGPDSTHLASGTGNPDSDGEVRLWDVTARKEEKLLFPKQHPAVNCLAYSSDGQFVAVGNSHGSTGLVIETASGNVHDKFHMGAGWVQAIGFSPDSKMLAFGTAGHKVYLRDVASKKPLRTLTGHQSQVESLAWTPDGTSLATGDIGGNIKLWDPATGKERLTQNLDGTRVTTLQFNSDGTTLFSGHGKGHVCRWQGSQRADFKTISGSDFRAIAMSSDNRTFAAATGTKTVLVQAVDSDSGKKLDLGKFLASSLAFSPAPLGQPSTVLAIGVWARDDKKPALPPVGECQLWDPISGQRLEILGEGKQAILAVAFTPDGSQLITGEFDGTVRIWNVAKRESTELGRHVGHVRTLTVSSDGRLLVSASDSRDDMRVWDLKERRELYRLPESGSWTKVAFLNQGATLVTSNYDKRVSQIRLWDTATGKPRASLADQSGLVLSLAASPDGQTIALGHQDRTIKLWDVNSRQLRAELKGHTREVNGVIFSRDGRYLVSAGGANAEEWVRFGEIKIWKADK